MFYTLFYLSDTLANVPYEALGPELTTEHSERNSVFFTAKIFMFVGEMQERRAKATCWPARAEGAPWKGGGKRNSVSGVCISRVGRNVAADTLNWRPPGIP